MFCDVCNMDFGSTYNLVFLTANIILMVVFFTCIVHYCYKSRSKNIYYVTPIESHVLVEVLKIYAANLPYTIIYVFSVDCKTKYTFYSNLNAP